jgi:hypothetical protein
MRDFLAATPTDFDAAALSRIAMLSTVFTV